jgi:hypothetical protein
MGAGWVLLDHSSYLFLIKGKEPTNMNRILFTRKAYMKQLFAFAIVLCCSLIAVSASKAQPNQQQQTNTSQVNWQDELRSAQEEGRALKTIISAIQSIDTARQNELIQYIVTDRSVRSRVISALRKSGREISPTTNADLIVTQKPGTREALASGDYNTEVELLRIVIESVGIYGAPTIKRILGEDLYNKINNRNEIEHTLISSPSPQQRIQYAAINASMFGGDFIFKSGFGIGVVLGNDYIGYPYWLPGNVAIQGIIHKEMTDARFGLNFQLGEAGITPFTISGGFNIKNRKLEGTQGFNAMINQTLNVLPTNTDAKLGVGGEFFQAFNPSINTLSQRATTDAQYHTSYHTGDIPGLRKDSLYYLSLSGHAWVSYSFGGSLKGLTVQVGGGTHRINAITVGAANIPVSASKDIPGYYDIVQAKSFDQFDPMLKVNYMHGGSDGYDWGVSLQYCNTLLADGFVQIFNWLDLEAKYSVVVGRDPKKWEWKDFVMVSPVLRLNF